MEDAGSARQWGIHHFERLMETNRPFETRPERVAANFGRNLRRVRLARCVSVSDLAYITGISHDALHKYENGRRNPGLDFFQRLVDGLLIEPGELLRLEERPLLPGGGEVEVLDVPRKFASHPIPQEDIAANFGRNVRHLRDQRGWTQTELGERFGTERSGIVRFELGQTMPRINTLVQMANALEVEPVALLVRNDKPLLSPKTGAKPTMQKKVLAYITANPGSEIREVVDAVGASESSVRHALARLRRNDKVEWGTPLFLKAPSPGE